MKLSEVEINRNCIIKMLNIEDEKIKLRLMELGLIEGETVRLARKSIFKKTLLIDLNFSCFTLKTELAKGVMVEYA